MMYRAAIIALALWASSFTGCSTVSHWLAEMASWRTGEGHTRQEMVNEYNSEAQSVVEMNGSY
jgi:hypothetical protein